MPYRPRREHLLRPQCRRLARCQERTRAHPQRMQCLAATPWRLPVRRARARPRECRLGRHRLVPLLRARTSLDRRTGRRHCGSPKRMRSFRTYRLTGTPACPACRRHTDTRRSFPGRIERRCRYQSRRTRDSWLRPRPTDNSRESFCGAASSDDTEGGVGTARPALTAHAISGPRSFPPLVTSPIAPALGARTIEPRERPPAWLPTGRARVPVRDPHADRPRSRRFFPSAHRGGPYAVPGRVVTAAVAEGRPSSCSPSFSSN
jgi:hypothetical protein